MSTSGLFLVFALIAGAYVLFKYVRHGFCPICRSKLRFVAHPYHTPWVKEAYTTHIACTRCSYRTPDVIVW